MFEYPYPAGIRVNPQHLPLYIDPQSQPFKFKQPEDDAPVGTDENGNPIKNRGLMRESASRGGGTVASQQNDIFGTFPLLYETNNDSVPKALRRRRKNLKKEQQQQKTSEDIENYKGDKPLDELLSFIGGGQNDSNKKAKKNSNVVDNISNKTQKSNKKNKDKKQKSPIALSLVEEVEDKGSSVAQPADHETHGGEDNMGNSSGKVDVDIMENGDVDGIYSKSDKVAKSSVKQNDKIDMSKQAIYNTDKLSKGTIGQGSIKEKEQSSTNSMKDIVTGTDVENNQKISDKPAEASKIDKLEMPATKSEDSLKLDVNLRNNVTVKRRNAVNKNNKSLSPPAKVENELSFADLNHQPEFACLKSQDESDFESVKSLPATQGSQVVDSFLSQRLSYAKMAAGSKVPDSCSSSEKRSSLDNDDAPVCTDEKGNPIENRGLNPMQYKRMRESPSSGVGTVASQQYYNFGYLPLHQLTRSYSTNKETDNDSAPKNGNPIKNRGLMRESASREGGTVASQQNDIYGTFPLLYETNNDSVPKALRPRRKNLKKEQQQQKKSEDIENYKGDKPLDELLSFIGGGQNDSNKKAKKNSNVVIDISNKTQKSKKKNKDKNQKFLVASSSVEDEGSSVAQPSDHETHGGEDNLRNSSGKADVYIVENGDVDGIYSKSDKVAKISVKQNDKIDVSKQAFYNTYKLSKGTIGRGSIKEKEQSSTDSMKDIVAGTDVENNKKISDKPAKVSKIDTFEMPATKLEDSLKLDVSLRNNVTAKRKNAVNKNNKSLSPPAKVENELSFADLNHQPEFACLNASENRENDSFILIDLEVPQVPKEDEFQVVGKKKKKVTREHVPRNHFMTNISNSKSTRRYEDKRPVLSQSNNKATVLSIVPSAYMVKRDVRLRDLSSSAYSALTSGKGRQSVQEGRGNCTGDDPIPSGLKSQDDSNFESVKSFPATQGSQVVDGVLSPRLSYAKMAAGPKVPDSCSSSEKRSSLDSDRSEEKGSPLYERKKSRSHIPPKDYCLFDGRLINLEQEDIDDLDKNNTIQIGKGSFGKVWRSENKSEGFGIHVVVKKTPLSDNNQDRTITREMMASRIMHPFILPLLAVVKRPMEKQEVWFVSPLCSKGDLHEAIKHKSSALNAPIRVKILLHISLALEYIHTKVPNVRDIILHKDISSKNVVLDDRYNARLIDFGLAREKNDDTSMAGGRNNYAHPEIGQGRESFPAREGWDYYAFGVIMRELLTSFGPEGKDGKFLKNMSVIEVKTKIDEDIWKRGTQWDKLCEMTGNILENKWTCSDFNRKVTQKLQEFWGKFNQRILPLANKEKCHICMINNAARYSSMTNRHSSICNEKIYTCIACEKNSFLNPVSCYCGTILTPVLGCRTGALLVAGKDADNEKINQAMAKDVKEIEKLISSKAPRIIGIEKKNIRSVASDYTNNADTKVEKANDADTKVEKDRQIQEEMLWPKVKDHIEYFSRSKDIDTLLIYISCHGEKSSQSGGDDENYFRLGSVSDKISLDDFEKELKRLENIEKLVLVLDRCHPPMLKFEKRERKFCQINACASNKKTPITEDGSTFTKHFIQGLKAKMCPDDCLHCKEYWRTSTHFVTFSSLFNFLRSHLKGQNPKRSINFDDDIFAFYTDDEECFDFEESTASVKKAIPMGYLHDMKAVKEKLLEYFNKTVGVDNVQIERQTFRKDSSVEKCDTIEKVMDAWVHRQPLLVTFHSG